MKVKQTVFVFVVFSGIIAHCRSTRVGKLNWYNPCSYSTRSVRAAKSLQLQVSLALTEYKVINKSLTNLYKSESIHKNYKNKNDLSTTNRLPKFYRDFYHLGKKTEKAMNQKMIIFDNKFNETSRTFTLQKIHDLTVAIMCEIHDTIKNKPLQFVENKRSNIKEPSNIKNRASLTEAMAIDSTLSATFNKLIRALCKSLKMKKCKNCKRKASQREDRKKRRRKKCASS